MTIDRTGEWWVGNRPEDIKEYLEAYTSSEGYEVDEFRLATCSCGCRTVMLEADDDEGLARWRCCDCGSEHFIGDSKEYWSDADPTAFVCIECNSDTANVGVGFSLYPDRTGIRWIYVGCRCSHCGVLGCITSWKVGVSGLELLAIV